MSQIDYQRINFEDAPSTATPLSAANLNRMDNAIAALCDYLAALETTVGELQEIITELDARVSALENPTDPEQGSGSEEENSETEGE